MPLLTYIKCSMNISYSKTMKKTRDSNKFEIDQIPLNGLEGRYSIGYTSINNRLNRLGIKPIKQGRRSYVSAEQLEVLDQLDKHIKAGGTIQSFLSLQAAPDPSKDINVAPDDKISSDKSQQQVIATLVNAIAALNMPVTLQIGTGLDRFAYYRVLEEAAEKGWELTTSEVAELLKIPVAEIEGDTQTFRQAGFVFNRCETTRQWENRWRVVKLSNK